MAVVEGALVCLLVFALTKLLRGWLQWHHEMKANFALAGEKNRILHMVATGSPLMETLVAIVTSFAAQATPGSIASLLRLNETGERLVASVELAPHLPEAYTRAIHNERIGLNIGSCGHATYAKEIAVSEDIATDIRWVPYRDFALSFGLRSCWSFPVLSSSKECLGSFAIYHRRVSRPTVRELEICRAAADLAAIAIQHSRVVEAQIRHSQRMHVAEQAANLSIWEANVAADRLSFSGNFSRLLDRTFPASGHLEGGDVTLPLSDFRNLAAELVHPDDLSMITASLQKVLSSPQETCWAAEARLLRRDGTPLWFRTKAIISRDETGAAVRFTGALSEFTKERELMESLEKAKQQAESATKAKSRFLAHMSHEIRTPLNGILGTINLLQERFEGEGIHLDKAALDDLLESIRLSGEALLHVVSNVLDFSKMEAGRLVLENKRFALPPLLDELARILGTIARLRDVKMRFRLEEGCPMQLWGDPLRLRQVLLNLLSNSIKFASRGQVELLCLRGQKEDTVCFRVTDNGVGMSHEVQAGLFLPFEQGDPTTTRRFGGTGLGLAICQHLIRLMNGSVSCVRSAPGRGSVFEVILPIGSSGPNDTPATPSPAADTTIDLATAGLEVALPRITLIPSSSSSSEDGIVQGRGAFESLPLIASSSGSSSDGAIQRPMVDGRFSSSPVTSRILPSSTSVSSSSNLSPHGSPHSYRGATTPPPAPTPPLTVLVAEDNVMNQTVICRILQHLGHRVAIARDGREAVEHVHRASREGVPFDVVLMDLMMPVMDGIAAAGELKHSPVGRELPIVALTADTTEEARIECLRVGIAEFLYKPVTIDALRKCLARAAPRGPHAGPPATAEVPLPRHA
jgi:signal transduction histidine kinase/CheY-like chemotaxis protein